MHRHERSFAANNIEETVASVATVLRGSVSVAPIGLASSVRITLNGDPFDVAGPLTVSELLARLNIDGRRVAVEHNLVVLKRAVFASTDVREGDAIEIVNFVGGG